MAKLESSAAESTSTEYSIELTRGLAALMVMAAHYLPAFAGVQSFGYTGVDLFFVLSGFVFAPYLFGRPLMVWPHLARRFFRLYPLYVVAVLTYAGLRSGEGGNYLLQHLVFAHTLQSTVIATHLNPAFWSLPPEVEFYLLLPLLARWLKRPRHVLLLLATSLVAHLVIVAHLPAQPVTDGLWLVLSVHLPGLLVEFVLGALAWHVACHVPSGGARFAWLVGGLLLWSVAATMFVHFIHEPADGARTPGLRLVQRELGLIAAFAYAAILVACVGWLRSPPRWVVRSAALWGGMSYGVYLFHAVPLHVLPPLMAGMPAGLMACLSIGLTLAMAQGLHHVVEAPLRAYGRTLAAERVAAGQCTLQPSSPEA